MKGKFGVGSNQTSGLYLLVPNNAFYNSTQWKNKAYWGNAEGSTWPCKALPPDMMLSEVLEVSFQFSLHISAHVILVVIQDC